MAKEDKLKAIMEAKRILKDDGIIMISYYMNDYAIIKHGFIENNHSNVVLGKMFPLPLFGLAHECLFPKG